ncbi:4'-phosphopantetheinyl transferase family protein [Streptomyces sp. NPDC058613]|uniref:4'-phosphopantetheinyl transferase family protein n=1 Tax=Streptomyces sp. NPDC058613 TaxID=3346556 RepID=UPI003663448C
MCGLGGPHGRPEAADAAGVHFSLSHSAEIGLIAIAAEPVGIDVELIAEPETAASVAEVLHPAEAVELEALPPAHRPAATTRAWTRKEAYLKGTGAALSRSTTLDYLGTGPAPVAGPGEWTVRDTCSYPTGTWPRPRHR